MNQDDGDDLSCLLINLSTYIFLELGIETHDLTCDYP